MTLSTTGGGRTARWINRKIKLRFKNPPPIKRLNRRKMVSVQLGGLVEELLDLALQKRQPSHGTTTPVLEQK